MPMRERSYLTRKNCGAQRGNRIRVHTEVCRGCAGRPRCTGLNGKAKRGAYRGVGSCQGAGVAVPIVCPWDGRANRLPTSRGVKSLRRRGTARLPKFLRAQIK